MSKKKRANNIKKQILLQKIIHFIILEKVVYIFAVLITMAKYILFLLINIIRKTYILLKNFMIMKVMIID